MQRYIYKVLFFSAIFFKNATADSKFIPRHAHIGVDLAKLIYYGGLINIFNDYTSYSYTPVRRDGFMKPNCPQYSGLQYEFNAGLNYKLLSWNADIGFGSAEWKGFFIENGEERTETEYKSKGFFVKYGLDFNFLVDSYENNAAYVGFRHSISFFSDSMKSVIMYEEPYITEKANYYPTKKISRGEGQYAEINYAPVEGVNEGLVANWFEIIAGVRLKLKSWIYVGCNLRYKFLLFMPKFELYQPYDIIGWGVLNDPLSKTAIGYNLYLHVGIPIKNQEPHDRKQYRKNEGKIDIISL